MYLRCGVATVSAWLVMALAQLANAQSIDAQTQVAPKVDSPAVSRKRDAPEEAWHDVVILRNGTRYSGTIIEFVPNDHLLVRLADNLVREVPVNQVVYAGAAVGAPPIAINGSVVPSQVVQVVARPGEAMVHFQSGTPGLVVWMSRLASPTDSSNGTGFVQICQTPCERPVAIGSYRIAYSVGGGKVTTSDSRIHIQREEWLQADLNSRKGARILGWIVLGAGGVTGSVLASYALGMPHGWPERKTYGTLSALSFVVGLGLGLPLGLTSDKAIVLSYEAPRSIRSLTDGSQSGFTGLTFTGQL